jgi:farnesyl-diphosphate farnesyltransferase
MRSTNPRDVAYMFRDYARKIHAKAVPADPSFLKIAVACGQVRFFIPHRATKYLVHPQIEQWIEHHYPTFVEVTISESTQKPEATFKQSDSRMRIVNNQIRKQQFKKLENSGTVAPPAEEESPIDMRFIFMVLGAFIGVMAISALMIVGGIHYFDLWDVKW